MHLADIWENGNPGGGRHQCRPRDRSVPAYAGVARSPMALGWSEQEGEWQFTRSDGSGQIWEGLAGH